MHGNRIEKKKVEQVTEATTIIDLAIAPAGPTFIVLSGSCINSSTIQMSVIQIALRLLSISSVTCWTSLQ